MTRTKYLKAVEAGFRRAAAEWVDDAAVAIVEASANDDLTGVTAAGSEEEAYQFGKKILSRVDQVMNALANAPASGGVLTIVTDKRGGRA